MMNITFVLDVNGGSRQTVNKIKNIERKIERALLSGKRQVGISLVKYTRYQIIKGRKTGRIYTIQFSGGRRRRHRSSAPGETHANLTGLLRRSLNYKSRGDDLEFGYGVGTVDAPPYAGTIEFGGVAGGGGRGFVVKGVRTGSRGVIKPRPTLRNSINEHNRSTIVYLRDSIDRSLRR